MTIRPLRTPQPIIPELVEIGDDISVATANDRGVRTTRRGVVGRRTDKGATRYYETDEGGTLFAFEPGKTRGLNITIHGRTEIVQQSLFDIYPEVKERVA